jgi:hypothetical protein
MQNLFSSVIHFFIQDLVTQKYFLVIQKIFFGRDNTSAKNIWELRLSLLRSKSFFLDPPY